MKKHKSSGMNLKEKLNLGLTLIIICAVGFYFFYINFFYILELLHINPNLLNETIRIAGSTILITTGLWLNLPVKMRLTIEALINSAAQTKNKFILMNQSVSYPFVLATKL